MTEGPALFSSVFVTGATGFVGGYFLEAMRASLPSNVKITAPGRELDLRESAAVRAAIAEAKPSLVVHLAAQSSVGQSSKATAETWEVNVGGTLALAKAVAMEAPGAMVAFASSAEVYGAAFNDGPVNEKVAPLPQSVYGRTKRAAEELLADTLSPDNRLIIFRPTNHSGRGQTTRFVLPAFAAQVAAIEARLQPPVIRVGSLEAERDFLDVQDVIQAYLAALMTPFDERIVTLNIASGQIVSIGQILDKVLALTDREVTVESDPARMRASDVPRAEVRADLLRSRTGWQATHPIDETIANVLAGFRNELAERNSVE